MNQAAQSLWFIVQSEYREDWIIRLDWIIKRQIWCFLSRRCSVCGSTVVPAQFNYRVTVICSLLAHWAKQQSSVICRGGSLSLSLCMHVCQEGPSTCTAESDGRGVVFFAMQLIIREFAGLRWIVLVTDCWPWSDDKWWVLSGYRAADMWKPFFLKGGDTANTLYP